MNVRLLFSVLFLGLCFSPLLSQEFRPLAGYEQLHQQRLLKETPAVPKADCGSFEFEGISRILAGEDLELKVSLDTFDLGQGVVFRCTGCNTANFGTAFLNNDTLKYGATAGTEQGLDTLTISACNAMGECADSATVVVLVQRAGQTFELGNRLLSPSSRIDIEVPTDMLPGGATCRAIEGCAPDYPGREQEFFFLNGQSSNNTFRYRAARYAGTDAVCVTLCNELGLCDVYRTTFTVERPILDLPFFDDFSYQGVRPAAELWQDEDVLVNRNFGVDPPSVGVATFDAVDSDGQPYADAGGSQATTIRDYLTSAPLDLSGETGTTLNFYVQPRGLGNRPERQDSFLVQFLDNGGNWNTVLQLEGLPNTVGNSTPLPFMGQTIPVPAQYLYNGFQFRFAAKSNERGAVDMWHLDYVKLDNESTALNTEDLAFTSIPQSLVAPYTSMPIRHLQSGGISLFTDTLSMLLRNHSENTPMNLSENGDVVLVSLAGTNLPVTSNTINPGFSTDNSVAPQTTERRARAFNNIASSSDNLNELRTYLFETTATDASVALDLSYSFTSANQANAFASGALRENDQVVLTTVFDEYMAYDDGSAEVTVEVSEGTTVLQRYDAFAEDELKGLSIRIPRGLGSLGSQDLRLVVYAGDTVPTDLLYSEDVPILFAEDFFRDSLQGFTTYLFEEVIDLTKATTYFVGWEQLRASRNIGIGFDRNNAPEDVQWFNTGNGWQRLTGTTTGAIMIRPLLSGFAGFATDTDEPELTIDLVDVFPNPTNGTLHLRPRPGHALQELEVRLFAANGAQLLQTRATRSLDLSLLPAGFYLLEVSDGTVRNRHKIIRR